MFRLPSEKQFLLGGMDYNDLFGRRKNTDHSPHIRSQMDLDTNLCLMFLAFTLWALFYEDNRTHTFQTLRDNMLDVDKGRFKEEDFK